MIENTNAFLNQLILLLAIPAGAWVLGKAIEAAVTAWGVFKQEQPDIAYQLESVADIAVRAAEQTGFKDGVKKAGKEKLNYALKLAAGLLSQKGIVLDETLIAGAIEAKVNELFPRVGA